MNKDLIVISVLALTLFPVAGLSAKVAGSTVQPTASISPPRALGSVSIPRPLISDSVKSGGASHTLTNSSVTVDVCQVDSYQAGCPNYCIANPTAKVCK